MFTQAGASLRADLHGTTLSRYDFVAESKETRSEEVNDVKILDFQILFLIKFFRGSLHLKKDMYFQTC